MRKRLILLLVIVITLLNFVPTSEIGMEQKREWSVQDSKTYAKDAVMSWSLKEWECLDKLWTKESNWRPKAYNPIKVMGKNAGGIPQILGLSPNTNPTYQIDRGVSYIQHRYITFCNAWRHFQNKGWY